MSAKAAPPTDPKPQKPRGRFRLGLLQRLRNNFLTGVVVVAPIGITIWLTYTVVGYVDSTVLPQVLPLIPPEYQPERLLDVPLPGLGLVVVILFLIIVGSFAKNIFGRELLKLGESWVDRMPVVRSIYNGLKQIVETIFSQNASSFEHACLVEYPRKGIWAVAFVSTETQGEVRHKAGGDEDMVSIFLPTTPNPTSGFLLFVPKQDVILLDMTVEDAAKMVISAGLVTPPAKGEAGEAPTPPEPEEPKRPYSDRRRQEDDADPAAAAARAARDPRRARY